MQFRKLFPLRPKPLDLFYFSIPISEIHRHRRHIATSTEGRLAVHLPPHEASESHHQAVKLSRPRLGTGVLDFASAAETSPADHRLHNRETSTKTDHTLPFQLPEISTGAVERRRVHVANSAP
ncbi:hypothetical protein [Nocardia sp. NPDC051750]|uniref:hypothetical protein n=1 Tax=Nocardia sp. NPDC051750 TaxID=3364325 RepID=UPI0037A500D3